MTCGTEWEYVHLTANGWVGGSIKIKGHVAKDIPAPKTAVLTVYREVSFDSVGPDRNVIRGTRLSNDIWLVKFLFAKFGHPQFVV